MNLTDPDKIMEAYKELKKELTTQKEWAQALITDATIENVFVDPAKQYNLLLNHLALMLLKEAESKGAFAFSKTRLEDGSVLFDKGTTLERRKYKHRHSNTVVFVGEYCDKTFRWTVLPEAFWQVRDQLQSTFPQPTQWLEAHRRLARDEGEVSSFYRGRRSRPTLRHSISTVPLTTPRTVWVDGADGFKKRVEATSLEVTSIANDGHGNDIPVTCSVTVHTADNKAYDLFDAPHVLLYPDSRAAVEKAIALCKQDHDALVRAWEDECANATTCIKAAGFEPYLVAYALDREDTE